MIREIFTQSPRREGVVVDSTTNPSNTGVDKNFLTLPGGTTIADFFVAPSQDRVYSFVVASRNLGYSRSLQLVKEGI